MLGVCITLPTGCTTDVNPVCGCNGQTYSNDCERVRARAQLDHAGACVPSSCAACNVATTYCQVTMGGVLGSTPSYACLPLPAALRFDAVVHLPRERELWRPVHAPAPAAS